MSKECSLFRNYIDSENLFIIFVDARKIMLKKKTTYDFYDFFEKREGRWGLARRQPIYEKDRLDPVDPSAALKLDRTILDRFPEGYRHLAYLQIQTGYKVKEKGMPGLKGPEVEQLYAESNAWLKGAPAPGTPG